MAGNRISRQEMATGRELPDPKSEEMRRRRAADWEG